jgi:hypothetical protein
LELPAEILLFCLDESIKKGVQNPTAQSTTTGGCEMNRSMPRAWTFTGAFLLIGILAGCVDGNLGQRSDGYVSPLGRGDRGRSPYPDLANRPDGFNPPSYDTETRQDNLAAAENVADRKRRQNQDKFEKELSATEEKPAGP